MPFTYLGEPIFKGAAKGAYLKRMADKIFAKFVSWKEMLLSMIGRHQLAKSVIQGKIHDDDIPIAQTIVA